MSSHNLGQVKRLPSRVVYLEHGASWPTCRPSEFFGGTLPEEATLFLKGELPWTWMMTRALVETHTVPRPQGPARLRAPSRCANRPAEPDHHRRHQMSVPLSLDGQRQGGRAPASIRAPLLVQFIREHLRLTGTHVGCDTAQCGACTVHLNGRAVKSARCSRVQAQGARRHDHRGPGARTARCIRCRRRSASATGCSAASARRAW